MNTKSRITSILKARSLDSSITGLQTFNLSELKLVSDLDFQLPTNIRLGHLAEKIVSELIKSSSTTFFTVILEALALYIFLLKDLKPKKQMMIKLVSPMILIILF